MSLPSLKAHRVEAALALEHRKRVLAGEDPAQAAEAVGVPPSAAPALRDNPAAERFENALAPAERAALTQTDFAQARAALESREGRAAWLAGVMTGELKTEGAFGHRKEFPPAVRLAAARLLGAMHGDFISKVQVQVEEKSVIVFEIPDNGRLPRDVIDVLPADAEVSDDVGDDEP